MNKQNFKKKSDIKKKSLGVKSLLFYLTSTWKLYLNLGTVSKVIVIRRNIGFSIQPLITVSIAIIQMSVGRDIRLLRVKASTLIRQIDSNRTV